MNDLQKSMKIGMSQIHSKKEQIVTIFILPVLPCYAQNVFHCFIEECMLSVIDVVLKERTVDDFESGEIKSYKKGRISCKKPKYLVKNMVI